MFGRHDAVRRQLRPIQTGATQEGTTKEGMTQEGATCHDESLTPRQVRPTWKARSFWQDRPVNGKSNPDREIEEGTTRAHKLANASRSAIEERVSRTNPR